MFVRRARAYSFCSEKKTKIRYLFLQRLKIIIPIVSKNKPASRKPAPSSPFSLSLKEHQATPASLAPPERFNSSEFLTVFFGAATLHRR